MNKPLRRAILDAGLDEIDIAAHLSVDPKTVQHWISGRMPYPRNRSKLAHLVNRSEEELWPQTAPGTTAPDEVHQIYQHRWAVPRDTWQTLFESATAEIGILVYSGLFLAEDMGLLRILAAKARSGIPVRILLGDPNSPYVHERGTAEGIGDAMPAKIRNAATLYRPLGKIDGVEIRQHRTILYNSIYRADDQLLVNTHVHSTSAAHAPVLHLRKTCDHGIAATYLASFERTWDAASSHPHTTPTEGVQSGGEHPRAVSTRLPG